MTVSRVFLVILAAFMLFLPGCSDVGVFAVVAISDKIDAGDLPEGLSARSVIHIDPSDGTTENYYFFSSGAALWAKEKTSSRWNHVPLNAGGTRWEGVQSAAATPGRLYVALYRTDGDQYTVGLFAIDSYNGSSAGFIDFNERWTSGSDGYKSIRLFCPNPASPEVYVNLLNHSGSFASADSENNGFSGSELYVISDPNAADWTADASELNPTVTSKLTNRYVTGIADNGTQVLISATTNLFSPDGGIVVDDSGSDIIYGSNVAVTGITWIDRSSFGTGGVFLLAGTSLHNGRLPLFASTDGSLWQEIPGTSTNFITTSFISVADKTAGQSDGRHLVLAGTSSYIDGSISRTGSGYNEIDITDDDLSKWSVSTDWNDYSFALKTNYSVSELAQATITGMSIPENGDILYAGTRGLGVWSIDLTEDRPSWVRE